MVVVVVVVIFVLLVGSNILLLILVVVVVVVVENSAMEQNKVGRTGRPIHPIVGTPRRWCHPKQGKEVAEATEEVETEEYKTV